MQNCGVSQVNMTQFEVARNQYNKELHDLRMKYGRIFTTILEGGNHELTSADDNQSVAGVL